MKPSRFTYHRPESVGEALGLLDRLGADAKVLAGGQSLIPIMNMRLAAPAHIIDINRIPGIAGIEADDGQVRVGALVRHADLEHDAEAYRHQRLLRRALRLVAHPAIRNRGTTVGSLVHADPSAELPAVLLLTGGSVQVRSVHGARDIPAGELIAGPLESSLLKGELALSATFGAAAPHTGYAITESARRHGDYALAGVTTAVTVAGGAVTAARAAYFALASAPVTVDLTTDLRGADPARLTDADWLQAAKAAVPHLDPSDDIHASAHYRAHLAAVLTGRALRDAAQDAA